MKIIVDTHILLFAANGSLTANRRALLQAKGTQVFFSSISLWELAKLIQIGKIKPEDSNETFLNKFVTHPLFTELSLSPRILSRVIEIAPSMHKDPADQIIVATALAEGADLMSNDKAIAASHLVNML